MNPYQLAILVVCLLPTIQGCNAQQENAHSREADQTSEFQTSQEVQDSWTDPLFFLDGQLCQHVRRIFEDSHGNLWFGTNVYGLMRYDGDSLEYFGPEDGLGSRGVRAIVEDSKGTVWFATSGGLSSYDGTAFHNLTTEDGLISDDLWSLIIDRDGLFWIGSSEGVNTYDGHSFKVLDIPRISVEDTTTLLSYRRITSIMKDNKGEYWFGTDGFGICRWNGETFSHVTESLGLSDNNITSIHQDKNGTVWIGSMFGGLSRIDDGKISSLLNSEGIEGIEIWSIYDDPEGGIWFPSEHHGIYHFDGQSFQNYRHPDGLLDGIQCHYRDSKGRFWVGGWGGLFRMTDDTVISVTHEGPWD